MKTLSSVNESFSCLWIKVWRNRNYYKSEISFTESFLLSVLVMWEPCKNGSLGVEGWEGSLH